MLSARYVLVILLALLRLELLPERIQLPSGN
jgi:hypothetical protein